MSIYTHVTNTKCPPASVFSPKGCVRSIWFLSKWQNAASVDWCSHWCYMASAMFCANSFQVLWDELICLKCDWVYWWWQIHIADLLYFFFLYMKKRSLKIKGLVQTPNGVRSGVSISKSCFEKCINIFLCRKYYTYSMYREFAWNCWTPLTNILHNLYKLFYVLNKGTNPVWIYV